MSSAADAFFAYKVAYEETDWALYRAAGMLEALNRLMLDHDFPEPNGPEVNAIMSVLSGAQEKVAAALTFHSEELPAAHRAAEAPLMTDGIRKEC